MADVTKAWHAVFDKGSKQAQERLKKVHGHKPEFQAFLKSRGAEGGERSVKQATTSLTKATNAKIAAQKIADMRFKKALKVSSDRVREMGRRRRESGEGLGGSLETAQDVIKHIKKYGSIKAGRLGEAMNRTQLIAKTAKDIEKKKAATKIVDRLKSTSYGRGAGLNPAKDLKLMPSSPLKTDMSALSIKRHSMNYEEVQIDEVSKKEAEALLGGPVKAKPKMPPGKQPAGYRYVRGLARKAMKAGMKKEEVEQVDEAIRGTIGSSKSVEIRRPADQAERDKLASDISANRKYNKGKIGRTSGNIRKNAAGMTDAQKLVRTLYDKSGRSNKELGPKKFPYSEEVEQADEAVRVVDRWYPGIPHDPQKRKDVAATVKKIRKDPDARGGMTGFNRYQDFFGGRKARLGAERTGVGEEVVTEAEGTVAVTPKEKALAAHHGDKTKITYGDVIKARLKSVAAKKMGK